MYLIRRAQFLTELHNFVLQVLVVRQDLKMGSGKIASQCARELFQSAVGYCRVLVHLGISHIRILSKLYFADAATGMYAELVHRCIL